MSLIKQNLYLNFKIRLYNFDQKKKIIDRIDKLEVFKPYNSSCDLEWIGHKKGYYIPNIKNLKYKPKYIISPGVGGSTEFEDYLYKNYQVNSITIDPNKSVYPPRC